MPAFSGTALGTMGPWGVIVPDLDRDFSGKVAAAGVTVSVPARVEDLRLVRVFTLNSVWWLLLCASLCLLPSSVNRFSVEGKSNRAFTE